MGGKDTEKFSSVQSLSPVWLFATPWTTAHQASLSITNSRSLLKLMSIESVMPSNHLILCRPLLLLPSIFPSIRVFSNKSVLGDKYSVEKLLFTYAPYIISGEGNGNPLQYSCLENPWDGGAQWTAVYGVTWSRTWLKRFSSSSSIYNILFCPINFQWSSAFILILEKLRFRDYQHLAHFNPSVLQHVYMLWATIY